MAVALLTGHAPVRKHLNIMACLMEILLQIMQDGDWQSVPHYMLLQGIDLPVL
jgi:hypothetical protein